MCNDIFTPGEGFSQYNEEQLALLKKMMQIKGAKREEIIRKTREEVAENLTNNEQEEEGEYLLGLA